MKVNYFRHKAAEELPKGSFQAFNGARITNHQNHLLLNQPVHANGLTEIRHDAEDKTPFISQQTRGAYISNTSRPDLFFLATDLFSPFCYTASKLLQRSDSLTVSYFTFSNKCLLEQHKPIFCYHIPQPTFTSSYLTFVDASLGKAVYGQNGYISGLYHPHNHHFLCSRLD